MGSSGFISPQPGLQLFRQGRFVLLPGQDQGLLIVVDRLVDPPRPAKAMPRYLWASA